MCRLRQKSLAVSLPGRVKVGEVLPGARGRGSGGRGGDCSDARAQRVARVCAGLEAGTGVLLAGADELRLLYPGLILRAHSRVQEAPRWGLAHPECQGLHVGVLSPGGSPSPGSHCGRLSLYPLSHFLDLCRLNVPQTPALSASPGGWGPTQCPAPGHFPPCVSQLPGSSRTWALPGGTSHPSPGQRQAGTGSVRQKEHLLYTRAVRGTFSVISLGACSTSVKQYR